MRPSLVQLLMTIEDSVPNQQDIYLSPMKFFSVSALKTQNRQMIRSLEQTYSQSNRRVIIVVVVFSIVAIVLFVLCWARTIPEKIIFESNSILIQFEKEASLPVAVKEKKKLYIDAGNDFLRLVNLRENNLHSDVIQMSSIDLTFNADKTINMLYASVDSSDESFNIC